MQLRELKLLNMSKIIAMKYIRIDLLYQRNVQFICKATTRDASSDKVNSLQSNAYSFHDDSWLKIVYLVHMNVLF